MPLLNNFKLGADPEFVILDDAGHITPYLDGPERYSPWGTDHGGWVIEPHPKPELSVRELVENLKVSMNDFATVAPTGKWRAGAYIADPMGRRATVTMGGHVHIDKPQPGNELAALDLFTKNLEKLDILPAAECEKRRGGAYGYGKWSDVRVEHGHWEYRTFPSWLFSQRVTKLCTLACKLATVDPASVMETMGDVTKASLPRLRAFYERFKGKDDDVDWVLNSGMLDKKLVIDPDRDLKEVWKVTPKKENPHWKASAPKVDALADALRRQQGFNPGDIPIPAAPLPVWAFEAHSHWICYLTTGIQLRLADLHAVNDRIDDPDLPNVEAGGLYYTANRERAFRAIGRRGIDVPEGGDEFNIRHVMVSRGCRVHFRLFDRQVGAVGIPERVGAVLTRAAAEAASTYNRLGRFSSALSVNTGVVYAIERVETIN